VASQAALEKSVDGDEKSDSITFKELIAMQEKDAKLKIQLMKNKHIDTCRYGAGYKYQPVYACQTCYE